MYEALQYAQDLLIQFGGHTMAAGFSVRAENIEALRRRLLDYAAAHMTAADYVPLVHIDKELEPADVTLDLIAELSRLEPYGMGNMSLRLRPGQLVMFPSWLLHQVTPFEPEGDGLRITVAFNARFRLDGYQRGQRIWA